MEILVTGAAGRIGSQVVDDLSENHHIVATGRRLTYVEEKPEISEYALDISNLDQLTKLFGTKQFDAVVHLAALTGSQCELDENMAYTVNAGATNLLGRLAMEHGVQRFINISTSAVYSQYDLGTDAVSMVVNPQSVYGATKLKAEHALTAIASEAQDMSLLSLRLFNVYGPRLDRSLVNRLMTPEEFPLLREFYRDYIHVDEVLRSIARALATDNIVAGEHVIVDIGSGISRSIEDVLADVLLKGWSPNAYWSEEETKHTYTRANTDPAAQILGFVPSVDLQIPTNPNSDANHRKSISSSALI
jgi:UDP-glucose 4-epimerase